MIQCNTLYKFNGGVLFCGDGGDNDGDSDGSLLM